MSERSKPRKPKLTTSLPAPPPLPPPATHNAPILLNSIMARKYSLFKRTLIVTILFAVAVYAFFNTFSDHSLSFNSDKEFTLNSFPNFQRKSKSVKVYIYDLPRKFTYGVIEHHAMARGGMDAPVSGVSSLKYPGHQHMAEWFLFKDLLKSESDRVDSPVMKVDDPDEADLFYVPCFSSLSLIVNPNRVATGASQVYSDEEMQDSLMEWLEEQEYWTRNNGWDHVFIAQDPNALYRVIDRIRNAVLLVSDFGRLLPYQASLVKDVIVPYSHRINAYKGEVGVENRNTLLFFMGNRYRKEGGKIRDLLFQVLEVEEDVIIKHGAQSRESRRAASQGMHSSKFCLHPAGDTPSACRLFDAIVSLCVPVIVSDSIELPFEDVIDYRKIAIFVESASAIKPGFVVSMLRTLTSDRIIEYQKELKEVKRYFIYDDPNGTVNEIWRQVSQKLPLIKLMISREKRLIKRELTEPDCSCLCSNHTGPITIL